MLSPRTQATLLLTGHIALGGDERAEPLDVREWNRLARWLAAHDLAPEDLVTAEAEAILDEWNDERIPADRLRALLDRGHTLALVTERWLGTGMWIIGRSDPGYPVRLKQHMKDSAPPLLFGYGDLRTFRNRGVAIVGSRDAAEADLALAESLGQAVSAAGCNVVSGGARGVDDRAARGAFAARGTVIVVVADSLLRNASKPHYRQHLLSGDLVLTTPYSPETGFSAGNAMGRNRVIYCLADAAVAVSSANGTGGTFGGASQNLRSRWVPLWVAPTDDPASGNPALVSQGAGWLPSRDAIDVESLFTWPEAPATPSAPPAQATLF
jgi:predicted Rossmann fold nucleotide-binding protein DprA/Smf involved in DNA uptake